MSTKNLETVSGTVEQINAKQTGIKVAGEWLNISQYHPLAELPRVGQRVQVDVERSDRGAWINSLQLLAEPAATNSPTSPSRDREIRRLACLKAAAQFGAGKCVAGVDVKSTDVLKIAEAFECAVWLHQHRPPFSYIVASRGAPG
jgi:hypothetical protein